MIALYSDLCTMSNRSLAWPIGTELPAELAFLANHISTYFNADPPYNKATLGATIFTPPPHTPKLLLIQMTKTSDPEAFSGAWEVPTGLPQPSDLTLLHALSRIIFERTSLRLSRVYAMPASEMGPDPDNPEWMKLLFTVQVKELDSDPGRFSQRQALAYEAGLPENYNFRAVRGEGTDPNSVQVLLNPQTHSRHAWVTEDDLREFATSGLYPIGEEKAFESMLDAFALYKQDCEQGSTRNKPTEKKSPSPTTSSAPASSTKKSGSPEKTSKSPGKSSKSNSARQSSSSKSKPDPSHFHRFRIT